VLELDWPAAPSHVFGGAVFAEQPVVRAVVRVVGGEAVADAAAAGWVTARVASVNGLRPVGLPPAYTFVGGAREVRAPLVGGVANFSGLYLNASDAVYSLEFSAAGRDAVYSDAIRVDVGPPVRLGLIRPPGGAVGGAPLATQPSLSLRDAGGNTVRGCGACVAVTPVDGNDTLTGAPPRCAAANGTVAWTNVTLWRARAGVVLNFSVVSWGACQPPPNTSVSSFLLSPPLLVVPGAPARIAVHPSTPLPPVVTAGEAWSPQPTVNVQDVAGNTVVDFSGEVGVVVAAAAGGALPPAAAAALLVAPPAASPCAPFGDPAAASHGRNRTCAPSQPTLLPWCATCDDVWTGGTASAWAGSSTLQLIPTPSTGSAPPLRGGDVLRIRDGASDACRGLDVNDSGHDELCGETGVTVRVLSVTAAGRRADAAPGAPWRVTIAPAWRWRTAAALQVRVLVPVGVARATRGSATFLGLALSTSSYAPLYLHFFLHPRFDIPDPALSPDALLQPSLAAAYVRALAAPNASALTLSTPMTVLSAPPAALRLLRPPAGCLDAGAPCATQPVIAVADALGNVLTLAPPLYDRTVVDGGWVAATVVGGSCELPPGASAPVVLRSGVAAWVGFALTAAVAGGTGVNCTILFGAHLPGYGFLSLRARVLLAPSAEHLLVPFPVDTPRLQAGTTAATVSGAAPAAAPPYQYAQQRNSDLPAEGCPAAGQRFGHAVASSGDVTVVGSPFDATATTAATLVELVCDEPTTFTDALQDVEMFAQWVPEVQRVVLVCNTTAIDAAGMPDADTCAGAGWVLNWRGITTRPLSANVADDYVAAVLAADVLVQEGGEYDRGFHGVVTVVSVVDTDGAVPTDCATCAVVRVWDITFENLYGALPLLVAIATSSSADAGMTPYVVRLQAAAQLAGNFTLGLPRADNNTDALVTRPVPITTPAAEIATIVAADLGMGALEVTDVLAAASLDDGRATHARHIRLRFASVPYSYDPPLLVGNASGLTGAAATLTVSRRQAGRAPLHGAFRLGVVTGVAAGPEEVWSAPIPWNAPPAVVAAALTPLVPGYEVAVAAVPPSDRAPVVRVGWAVRLRRAPPRDTTAALVAPAPFPVIRASPTQPSPPRWVSLNDAAGLLQAGAALWGTGARAVVTSSADPAQVAGGRAPGAAGVAAAAFGHTGSATVFRTRRGARTPALRLLPPLPHRDDFGRFGSAVGVATASPEGRSLVAIGAPAAVVALPHEVQRIWCAADAAATFSLGFRGAWTPVLAGNVTLAAAVAALQALPTVGTLAVSQPGDGDVSRLAVGGDRTLCAPAGAPPQATTLTFVTLADGNLPAVEVSHAEGWSGSLWVEDDVVAGEARSAGDGAGASIARMGAAFLWELDARDTPVRDPVLVQPREALIEGAGFGSAVSVALRRIATPVTNVAGTPLTLAADTSAAVQWVVAIAAPAAPPCGAVWVATCDLAAGVAACDVGRTAQVLRLSVDGIACGAGTRFGAALAVSPHGNTVAVGAPGGGSDGSGAVYVYKRQRGERGSVYLLDQALLPTFPVAGSAWGGALALSSMLLVVGAPAAPATAPANASMSLYVRSGWGERDGGYFAPADWRLPLGSLPPGFALGTAVAASDTHVLVAATPRSARGASASGLGGAGSPHSPTLHDAPVHNDAAPGLAITLVAAAGTGLPPAATNCTLGDATGDDAYTLNWRDDGTAATQQAPAFDAARSVRLCASADAATMLSALRALSRRAIAAASVDDAMTTRTWRITFAASTEVAAVGSEHDTPTSPLAGVHVTAEGVTGRGVLHSVAVAPWGVDSGSAHAPFAYILAREGTTTRWRAQAVATPEVPQVDDGYGSALAATPDGRAFIIGSPTRVVPGCGDTGATAAGAAVVLDTSLLAYGATLVSAVGANVDADPMTLSPAAVVMAAANGSSSSGLVVFSAPAADDTQVGALARVHGAEDGGWLAADVPPLAPSESEVTTTASLAAHLLDAAPVSTITNATSTLSVRFATPGAGADASFHVSLRQPGLHAVRGGQLWATVAVDASRGGATPASPAGGTSAAAGGAAPPYNPPGKAAGGARPRPSPAGGAPRPAPGAAGGAARALWGPPRPPRPLVAVGAPATPPPSDSTACPGAVLLYLQAAAGVTYAGMLTPPRELTCGAGLGYGGGLAATAVASSNSTNATVVLLAVATPAATTVTVYTCAVENGAVNCTATSHLQVADAITPPSLNAPPPFGAPHVGSNASLRLGPGDACGARSALALVTSRDGDAWLAVGCPGGEVVRVWHGVAAAVNAANNSLPSWQWRPSLAALPPGRRRRVHDEWVWQARGSGFGTAVALGADGTLAVGAPTGGDGSSAGCAVAASAALPAQIVPPVTDVGGGGAGSPPPPHGLVYLLQYLPGVAASYMETVPWWLARAVNWTSVAGWRSGASAHAAGTAVPAWDAEDGAGSWACAATLRPSEPAAGDAYGASVALAGDNLIVGAPGAALLSHGAVSWNFEAGGSLVGWDATGSAFSRGPTPGAAAVGMEGEYFIHTAYGNARGSHDGATSTPALPLIPPFRAASAANASAAVYGWTWDVALNCATTGAPSFGVVFPNASSAVAITTVAGSPRQVTEVLGGVAPGTAAGAGATGTLTSRPFLLAGGTIAFKVAGGCDARLLAVELVVEGNVVRRATGTCSRVVADITWRVQQYAGAVAQLRIVDEAGDVADPWGWLAGGAFTFDPPPVTPAATPADAAAAPRGAAYVYRRVQTSAAWGPSDTVRPTDTTPEFADVPSRPDVVAPTMVDALLFLAPSDAAPNPLLPPCTASPAQPATDSAAPLACAWLLQRLLLPTRHTATGFGVAVAVSDAAGIALVAAPGGAVGCQQHRRRTDNVGEPTLVAEPAVVGGGGWGYGSGAVAATVAADHHHASTRCNTNSENAATGSLHWYRALPDKRGGGGPTGTGNAGGSRPLIASQAWLSVPDSVVEGVGGGNAAASLSPDFYAVVAASRTVTDPPRATLIDAAFLLASLNPVDTTSPAVQRPSTVWRHAEVDAWGRAVSASRKPLQVPAHDRDRAVSVRIYRHGGRTAADPASPAAGLAHRPVWVGYATVDGSARGMNATEGAACIAASPAARRAARCGDFVHTAGVLALDARAPYGDVWVRLVDDGAPTARPARTFTFQLFIAGGPPLSGPDTSATVTIAGDDGTLTIPLDTEESTIAAARPRPRPNE